MPLWFPRNTTRHITVIATPMVMLGLYRISARMVRGTFVSWLRLHARKNASM